MSIWVPSLSPAYSRNRVCLHVREHKGCATRSVPDGQRDPGTPFQARQSERDQLATAHYAAGLGYLGLNNKERARQEMTETLQAIPRHYSITAWDTALSKSYSSDRPAGPCTKSTTASRSFRFTHQYVPNAPDQP